MPSLQPFLVSLLIGTAATPLVGVVGAEAQTVSQPGYSRSTKCFRDEYREEYVPGTKDRPGYVRNWTEKVEIACSGSSTQASTCLLYTSPSPRDLSTSRMPSSA